MINTTQIRQYQLARDLITAGTRTKIVAIHTGMAEDRVRDLWRQIHGCSPKPGPMPEIRNILRTRGRLVEASLLMGLYLHYRQEDGLTVDIHGVLKGWHKWTVLRDASMPGYDCLTINDLWMMARLHRQGDLSMRRCSEYRCGFVHVDHPDARDPGCPVCLLARHKADVAAKRRRLIGAGGLHGAIADSVAVPAC